MLFRLLVPAFAWIALMFLVIFREYSIENNWEFAGITRNSIIQIFMFMVFSHIVKGVIMKQLRYPRWKEHADKIVFLFGALTAMFFEIVRSKLVDNVEFSLVNLFLDIVGVLLGIVIFRLLYRSCC